MRSTSPSLKPLDVQVCRRGRLVGCFVKASFLAQSQGTIGW